MESNVALVNVTDVPIHYSLLVFPLKLYRFLHEEEEYHLSHIASFQPDGRSFRIHNRIEFVTATVRWFSFSKFESFQRQLNIYGFKRVLGGTDKGCYYHKNFIQGQYLLAQSIKRIPVRKMMIDSSINRSPVTGAHEMTSGTSSLASPNIASANRQHIQNDIVNRHDGDTYNQRLTTTANVAIQPYFLQDATADQYVDVNNLINHYLRNKVTNSISTLRANNLASSIPMLQTQPNIRGTDAPLLYDTDASTLSVLQRLQNSATQSVIDSLIPSPLSPTALASLPHQQTSAMSQSLQDLLNALTNHARLQTHGLVNRARLQTPPEMDLSPLLLHLGAHTGNTRGPNQLHPSQSSTLSGSMPIHPNSSVNVAVIQDILLQQQNELNRRLPDEQTIRYAIMLLQQQLPPS